MFVIDLEEKSKVNPVKRAVWLFDEPPYTCLRVAASAKAGETRIPIDIGSGVRGLG